MLTRKLADEIARQVHGDILSYDWLLKITEEQLVGKSFSERTTALAESLELLMKEEGVTIGPSKLVEGKYVFRIGTTPLKQLSNEFVNTFISMVILAKTMKSPLAFGSAFPHLRNRL